jgi:hypothetical protein
VSFCLTIILSDGSEKRILYADRPSAEDCCIALRVRGITAWVSRA